MSSWQASSFLVFNMVRLCDLYKLSSRFKSRFLSSRWILFICVHFIHVNMFIIYVCMHKHMPKIKGIFKLFTLCFSSWFFPLLKINCIYINVLNKCYYINVLNKFTLLGVQLQSCEFMNIYSYRNTTKIKIYNSCMPKNSHQSKIIAVQSPSHHSYLQQLLLFSIVVSPLFLQVFLKTYFLSLLYSSER